MAASKAASSSLDITFFGTCPTSWDNLTPTEKNSCIGNQLIRQIEGHFAWAAAGPLLDQWNKSGEEEYSAVIAHGKVGIFSSLRQHKIPGHELRLLSLLPDKETAIPFVIITSKGKDDKAARETIERLKHHPRIARFALKYLIRQGNTRLTMGRHTSTYSSENRDRNAHVSVGRGSANVTVTANETVNLSRQVVMNQETQKQPESLCGARIAVYARDNRGRGKKSHVSTIAAIVNIGNRCYALTVAHVFFDNVDTSKSWADSGLYVTSESSLGLRPEAPIPRSSKIYEVVIESLWPHNIAIQDGSEIKSTSIGLVAPSLPHRRKDAATAALPEVLWDAELDWALIELRDPILWRQNSFTTSSGSDLSLHLPQSDVRPPNDEVVIAAGVSGEVNGLGLGTVGGILLPWSSREIKTWSVEGEIAVGDSGSLAICPKTGLVYGIVVAYDSDTLMTYIVPMLSVFESILQHFELNLSSMSTLFSIPSETSMHSTTTIEELDRRDEVDSHTDLYEEQHVHGLFLSKLKSFTARSVSGQQYIHKSLLIEWLLSKHSSQATYLDLLLDSAYSDCIIVPVDAHQLSGSSGASLLVFSLLLELGRGDLMHHFLRRALTDIKLPFSMTTLRQALPRGDHSQPVDLADQIFDEQWAYCPLIFDLDMGLDLPSSTVIPIQKKNRINSKGGTATVWEITIHEEFVGTSLRRAASSAKYDSVSDKAGTFYQFALKTFDPDSKSLFEAEREAFRTLQGNPHLIRCLGDYTHGEQYNILLEYCEVDLDEYFATTPPPARAPDIYYFWEGLFEVAEAVRDLHSFRFRRAGVEREYHGWHADIKPDNILRAGSSFKLADFGFAAFKSMNEESTLIRGGTVTYGAPECYRTDGNQNMLSQAIDIWSLGCVLSEAACWVVLGEPGIQQFSSLRDQAIKSWRNEQFSWNQFHNGTHVLREVRQWHDHLRSVVRHTDVITARVLDLIDQHMLLDAPKHRYSAIDICAKLNGILVKARSESMRTERTQLASSPIADTRMPFDNVDALPTELLQSLTDPLGSSPAIGEQESHISRFRSCETSHTESISPEAQLLSQNYIPSLTQKDRHMIDRTSSHGSDSVLSRSQSIRLQSPATVTESFEWPTTSKQPNRNQSMHRPVEQSHPVLTMTIAEAHKAVDEKRASSIFSRFKQKKEDKFLSKYIHDRDLVFLVDNGETMATHWREVTYVLETLAYMLRQQDPDGLDLSFTFGKTSCRSNNARKLTNTMRGKDVEPSKGVHTNMASALGKALSGYLQSLASKPGQARSLSLYVLTDGLWLGTPNLDAVFDVFAEFCTKFEKLDRSVLKSERRVGIQFIQFGNEPEATSRLQRLDSELPSKGTPDIVDTEPATGNVWKMLLGNFVDEFDYSGDKKSSVLKYGNK